MRIAATAGLIVSAAALAACGRRSVEIDPNAQPVTARWNATLASPAQLAGALQLTGSGWMGHREKNASQTHAHVAISNAAPGGQHPWHVHRGQCGDDLGVLGPADAYSVLKVGGDGKASGDADLPLPLPTTGQYFINVHASAANMSTIVACGNLAPPAQ
jgi:hypothetical protein